MKFFKLHGSIGQPRQGQSAMAPGGATRPHIALFTQILSTLREGLFYLDASSENSVSSAVTTWALFQAA